MALTDNRTGARKYLLPHPANDQDQDVLRLIAAFQAIDIDVMGLLTALGGKAESSHTHTQAQVSGLTGALSAKADRTHSHKLGDLSDVDALVAVAGHILRFNGQGWQPGAISASDLTTGTIDPARLPPIALTDTHPVNSQAEMLALTAQRGDVAVRQDIRKSFILRGENPGQLSNWQELLTPIDAVLSVAGLVGVITVAALKAALSLDKAVNKTEAEMVASGAIKTALDAKSANGHNHDGSYYLKSEVNDRLAQRVAKGGDTMTGELRANSFSASGASGSFGGGYYSKPWSHANFPYSVFLCSDANEHEAQIHVANGYRSAVHRFDTWGNAHHGGTLYAAAKNFVIPHPLLADRELVHVSIEGPEHMVAYRGHTRLVSGRAVVQIDAACEMTAGTFAALTVDARVAALTNQDGFAGLRATPVLDGQFEVICEDAASSDMVSWLVLARRNDPWVRNMDPNVDRETGRFITERWAIPGSPPPPPPPPPEPEPDDDPGIDA